jgi:hypothetical protein
MWRYQKSEVCVGVPAYKFEFRGLGAGLAQLVEQLFCKQQVIGSSPVSSSSLGFKFWRMVRFRSGQTDQTVNLAASAFEGSIPSLTTT